MGRALSLMNPLLVSITRNHKSLTVTEDVQIGPQLPQKRPTTQIYATVCIAQSDNYNTDTFPLVSFSERCQLSEYSFFVRVVDLHAYMHKYPGPAPQSTI